MANIELTDNAVADLNELEHHISDRIKKKLEEIQDWPGHYLDRLQGYPYHKLRVGDYRVIVEWDKGSDTIYVITLGHRRNIYDQL